MENTWQPWLL